MESKQLIAYLKQVVSLEKEVQIAQISYQRLLKKPEELGRYRQIQAPVQPKEAETDYTLLLCGMLAFALAALLTYIVSYSGNGFLIGLLAAILQIFGFLPVLIIILIVLFGIYLLYGFVSVNKDAKDKYWQECRDYREALKRYDSLVAQDHARVAEDKAMAGELKNTAMILKERKEKSEETLRKFYELDVIRPKYRNLLCVATFLEYLENERCYSLTGHEGCYNLFEEELQRGLIISKLSDISNQLETIRQNQERAADALDEIQRTSRHLCEGIERINGRMDVVLENQRVQAYCTEQLANDQRILKNYVMMRDWFLYAAQPGETF